MPKRADSPMWSGAGHAFLFQQVGEFVREVDWFLNADLD